MDGCGDEIAALHQLEVATQNGNELPLDHVTNISDVLEVLSRDPACLPGTEVAPSQPLTMGGAYVEIVEQPAPKALRFRYECEGRSAGSIPGVNSKSDNRTYPTIKIHNYIGQVTIVVSCVTKEDPYRAHPHNLVGRERCERGVCTIRSNITAEANEYQFKNLGIQCVKRRDIAEALQQRAALRVDPFRNGFEHRNNPQSIDLNAVRLAFQVFVPESNGRSMYQLKPVVSDIIFDKKAMCDLQIMRSSHCSGPVTGGTQIILLTEKIQREDTVVEFYQEEQSTGAVRWSAAANPVYVHRLTALVVETPPYNPTYFKQDSNSSQIMVRFHLRRLSDKQCSNSLPFEYVPEYRGTERKPAPDLAALARLLAQDSNNNKEPVSSSTDTDRSSVNISDDVTEPLEETTVTVTDVNGNPSDADMPDAAEKSLNDLLEQVAELDEIYSENRTRLETVVVSDDAEEEFNDAGTYTSLQLAFRNPVDIAEPEPAPYEDVQVQTYRGPIIEFSPLKRDSEERAPPLPPKRVRRPNSAASDFKTSQTSVSSVLKPGRQLPLTRDPDALKPGPALTTARSEPALPPVKKRSFFSRIFRRKEKSPAPSVKSEGKRESKSKPVGRSVSSVSGVRPSRFKSSVSHASLKDNTSNAGLSYADSITHISLHGDGEEEEPNFRSSSATSLKRGAAPPTGAGTILVAESVLALDADAFKKLQDDLELTDAEHYALYMAVAPHATASEFDETSCYYSPIDAYTKGAKRKAVMSAVMNYDDRALQPPIKMEPNRTPPHIYSPPGINHPEPQQQWTPLEPMMAGNNPFIDAGAWANPVGAGALGPGYAYAHGSPMGPVSPHHNLQSPLSPHHSPQPQPQPQTYQIADTPMMANISALLNEGSEAPIQQDLFSISSLIEDRDNMNLSDSLRQLSTNDLFQQ